MTKQINLVINGKVGVGKSFFATNFVQYLKDRGIDHRAIDSEGTGILLQNLGRCTCAWAIMFQRHENID